MWGEGALVQGFREVWRAFWWIGMSDRWKVFSNYFYKLTFFWENMLVEMIKE
jgi:hypothetical protein